MNEKGPSSTEYENPITREVLIAEFKKFVDEGITHPNDMDPRNPKFQKELQLYNSWCEQLKAQAGNNEQLQHQSNLMQTMFFIDAGFSDPDYLDEVLNDWLAQDEVNIAETEDSPEKVETQRQLEEAKKKIKTILNEQQADEEI